MRREYVKRFWIVVWIVWFAWAAAQCGAFEPSLPPAPECIDYVRGC